MNFDLTENKMIKTGKEFLIKYAGYTDSDVIMGDRGEMPRFSPSQINSDAYYYASRELDETVVFFSDARRMFFDYNTGRIRDLRSTYTKMMDQNDRINKIIGDVRSWSAPTPDHERMKQCAIDDLQNSLYPAVTIDACKKLLSSAVCCEETVEDVYRYVMHKRRRAIENVNIQKERCDNDIKQEEKKWEFKKEFFKSIKDM